MTEFNALDAYLRFVLMLAGGLTAFSIVVSGVIDQFFTENSLRDYRRAKLIKRAMRHEADPRELDIEDVSIFDLASQLTYGRSSKKRELEAHRNLSSKSYRSMLSV